MKTEAEKNRIVPIHSKIYLLVKKLCNTHHDKLFYENNKQISKILYYRRFKKALRDVGIKTEHTPHDCRHPYVKPTTKNYSISKTPHSTMKCVMGSSVHS